MAASSKNVLPPFHLVEAGDMSADVTSAPANVQFLDNIVYQAQWTGTPTGTFAVQGSLDYNPTTNINPGNWETLPLSASVAAVGSADQALFDLNQLPYPWIRLVYTAASGSGTLDVYVSGKAV